MSPDKIKEALECLGISLKPLKKWVDQDPEKALKILNLAIKKAFRIKAFETHPDQGGNVEAFTVVDSARKYLEDLSAEQVINLYPRPGEQDDGPKKEGAAGGFKEEEKPFQWGVSFEIRRDKVKIIHEGEHETITSFVRLPRYMNTEEIESYVQKMVSTLEKSGLIPHHRLKLLAPNPQWCGYDEVSDEEFKRFRGFKA